MKSVAIAEITRTIGSTIVVGITSDPVFTGDEVVICSLKVAGLNNQIPRKDSPVILTMAQEFVESDDGPLWLFSITSEQSAELKPDTYITDVKVKFASGYTQIIDPITIRITPSVS